MREWGRRVNLRTEVGNNFGKTYIWTIKMGRRETGRNKSKKIFLFL